MRLLKQEGNLTELEKIWGMAGKDEQDLVGIVREPRKEIEKGLSKRFSII